MADQVLRSFEGILEETLEDEITRDAAIQRFEYSFEAVWKTLQRYLRVQEGIQVGSPKGVVRSAFQVGLLNEEDTEKALLMVDDRNLTVHTYNRDLAISLTARLRDHAVVMRRWLDAIRDNL